MTYSRRSPDGWDLDLSCYCIEVLDGDSLYGYDDLGEVRLLADVARTGGWQAVLARIASGEKIVAIGRSFGVTPGFFSGLLHADRARHDLVAEARRRASGRAPLAEVAELLGGFALPTARL